MSFHTSTLDEITKLVQLNIKETVIPESVGVVKHVQPKSIKRLEPVPLTKQELSLSPGAKVPRKALEGELIYSRLKHKNGMVGEAYNDQSGVKPKTSPIARQRSLIDIVPTQLSITTPVTLKTKPNGSIRSRLNH